MGKIIDRGHYVAAPLPSDAVLVADGLSREDVLVFHPGGASVVSVGGQAAGRFSTGSPVAYILEKNAVLRLSVLVFPGADMDLPLSIDLVGEGSSATVSAAFLCTGSQKVSFRVEMRHRVGGCTSRQLFNGILSDNARSSFDGRIVVAPDAMQTKACQENHNILLSAGARAETRPQLEIYADDVECSHGATVGSLDDNALFYMRSRGIPEAEARRLQLVSFLSPVLADVPAALRDEYLEALRGMV